MFSNSANRPLRVLWGYSFTKLKSSIIRSRVIVEIFGSGVIVLQIHLKDITKRPLRLTSRSETRSIGLHNLKLIGEELWLCRRDRITVYDYQWNELREIRLGEWARRVAAFDTKTVVIATIEGLVISSTAGMNIRVQSLHIL